MKKLYTLLVVVLATLSSTAQIVNIPDANFKAALLLASSNNGIASNDDANDDGLVNYYNSVDINGDGEIQLSEAQTIKYLSVGGFNIVSLEGINSFSNLTTFSCTGNLIESLNIIPSTNLKRLNCDENLLTTLDVSIFPNLKYLGCGYNFITSLNLNGLINLKEFGCNGNQLTNLDVSNLPSLIYFECLNNQLTSLNTNGSINLLGIVCFNNNFISLDFSHLINLYSLEAYNCSQLVYLNIKNGIDVELEIGSNLNLRYICVDELQVEGIEWYLQNNNLFLCNVNSYCSFVPGGRHFIIQGNTALDIDNNGCDVNDLAFAQIKFNITDETNTGTVIANQSGTYTIPVAAGTHTITPLLENPSYFSVSPTTIDVTFPDESSPYIQDFCITPNGIHNDIEASIIPLTAARPGFDSRYKVIFKNKGNQPASGTVTFAFDDDHMDFVSSIPMQTNQSYSLLSWDYIDLLPFETREIIIQININSPTEIPAVNIGDIIKFSVVINPINGDEYTSDNANDLRQVVVGSYDPNDKTCVEGNTITPSMVGQYVHYVIRFENTGTFPAQNVVVSDVIDATKFDIASLVPQSSSHSFVTRINNASGKVEFIFENINLPFDDANNDGYVAFKIKTKSTLVLGDTFSNTANIYFDYNFPIVTNTATTTIAALSNQDFDFGSYFSVYPNPAKDVLHLASKNEIGVKTINIYNTLGQMVLVVTNPENNTIIDVANLKTGTYFIKVLTDKGMSNTKFIKE